MEGRDPHTSLAGSRIAHGSMGAAIVLACVAGAMAGCGTRRPEPIRAFYHWRSTYAPSDTERAILSACDVRRLYVRFFDVQWDDALDVPVPTAEIDFRARPADTIEIVPVVFVTNETVARTDTDEIAPLAGHIAREADDVARRAGIRFRELQVDCDWSDRTRDRYFTLLSSLRDSLGPGLERLAATIRLHQVKYRERTGVPPVDRGMLMFYNMGTPTPTTDENSIFTASVAARYLARIGSYPLPLDVALPVFRWTLQFRAGRLVGILDKTALSDLASIGPLERIGSVRARARSGFLFRGGYIAAGDVLKEETVPPDLCLRAARMLAPELRHEPRTVALFELDNRYLSAYDVDTLLDSFRTLE
jgi:hypothetical protein